MFVKDNNDNKIQQLQKQIDIKNAKIAKLQKKVLPNSYYCKLNSGKRGICVSYTDDRFIDDIGNDEFFVEIR